jgi:glycosyltransferase involved in cell wall biosynthesis
LSPHPDTLRILLAASAASANTRSIVESLTALGHELHVATLHPGSIPGAEVHVLGKPRARLGFLAAVPRMRRLHERLRPDLTLGYYASSYGMLAASVPRPRVVLTAGSDVIAGSRGRVWSRWVAPVFAGRALRAADLVVCWADHVAGAVRGMGVPACRILVTPRGVDTEIFRPAPPADPAVETTIVSTRTLEPFYRNDTVISAAARVMADREHVRLVLAGDGPSRGDLESLARVRGIESRARFAGRLPASEVADLLGNADVYASVPPSEGTSASLLEAMACGLVPVVTDLPGNRDWIEHGENGLLVSLETVEESLVEMLSRAVDDRELAARCRTRNPQIIEERASRSRNALRFERAFRELVGAGSTQSP